jgi:acyl carrier protein
MVPAGYRIMHGFPRLINGKIDKKALTYDIDNLITEKPHDLNNLTPIELKIYDIWCKILKTTNIGISDNFFDIGGNSLLAISIISKVEAEFNIELNLRLFFDGPNIKDLSENVEVLLGRQKSRMFVTGTNHDSPIITGHL